MMMKSFRSSLLLLALLMSAGATLGQQFSPSLYQDMHWRMIGPFRGGRSVAVAGVPGKRDLYYFGAVGGGVWQTTNSGRTWTSLWDKQPTASIGAVAVAPSDPNVIYVGTGEADIRSDLSLGDGVYKSTDAGHTWTHIGLRDTRQIGRILVDPRNPDVVLVAALGHAYASNPDRGVFRSTDGGKTWQKVLYKDASTGAVDLSYDAANPQTVYAALWNAHRPPWSTYAPINGSGSALYKSTDGGVTWTQLTGHGLPAGQWGRVGIGAGQGNGIDRVYVVIESPEGGLFRSDDGGDSWLRVGTDNRVRGRAWYFSGITVDPRDPDIVYMPNVSLYRSTDGGRNFTAIKGAPGGDDYHALWIDPKDPQRMIVGSDQGTVISVDGGKTWSSWYNQPTAQIYHVTTDNQFPYWVYGAQQDSGTVGTTSRSDYGRISFRDWFSVGGGESGYIAPDPSDPNIIYAGDTNGRLYRFTKNTGQSQDISPTVAEGFGTEINQRRLRHTWTSPLVFSPQDPHTLYFGAQYVLKTTDGGMNWQAISPDLTGADPQASASGPLTPESAKARGYGAVYTIAPSPLVDGQIWVGSDTGLIHLTRDGGKTWSNVTPPGLSAYSKISILDASHLDAGTAYAAVDRHRLDDYAPYIYRTHDFGKTWARINAGIAAPAYVHAVREDPKRKGLLYAGTETGVYVSFDDGDHWQPLQLNLPAAPVHDLVVKNNDLVVATHGRSFWILDDLTPLRQINEQVVSAPAHLFQPQVAIRMHRNVTHDTPLPPETPGGENPPTGAILDFYLAREPQDEVTLEILDSAGKLVRRFRSSDPPGQVYGPLAFPDYWIIPAQPVSRHSGMNRFVWNLRYPQPAALNFGYPIGAAFGQDTASAPQGPQVLPGQYQVRLTVDGKTYTQRLTVTMDPRVTSSGAELAQQFDLEMQVAATMERDFTALKQVQDVRAQLRGLKARLGADTGEVVTAIDALDQKAVAIEGRRRGFGDEGGDGRSRGPTLTSVNGELGNIMNVADSADHAPTTQVREAFRRAQGELKSQLAAWENLQAQDLKALNALLSSKGLGAISVSSTRATPQ